MITCIVDKYHSKKDNNNRWTLFELHGINKGITPEELKKGIKERKLNVLNMKVTADNRLLFKTTEEILEAVAPIIVPIMKRLFTNRFIFLDTAQPENFNGLVLGFKPLMISNLMYYYDKDWFKKMAKDKQKKLYPYMCDIQDMLKIKESDNRAVYMLLKKLLSSMAGEEKQVAYYIDNEIFNYGFLTQIGRKVPFDNAEYICSYIIQAEGNRFKIYDNN